MLIERQTRCDDASLLQPRAVREARVDFSTLSPVDRLERTPTGGVRVRANVGRAGVLVYQRADGSVRREYRPDDEAFAPTSLESISDAVVTVGHPPDSLVTPRTVRTYQVGHVRGAARRDGRMILAELAVLDADTIDAISTGQLVELSSGYTCRIDATPGVSPAGEAYDVVQRDVAYNHVALLPAGAGRAGRDAKLRFDGAEVRLSAHDDPKPERTDAMKEIINGREYTVGTPEWAAAHALRCKRLDELEEEAKDEDKEESNFKAKLDELTKERDTLKTELDAMRAKVDELEKKLGSPDEEKLDSLVDERVVVRDIARRVLGADAKLEGKSNDAIRREVVAKLDGAAALLDGGKPRSSEMMRTYFDARTRSLPKGAALSPLQPLSAAPARLDHDAPAAIDPRALYTPPGRR